MRLASTEAQRGAVTITLVERYPLVRATLRDMVAPEPDLRIVAEVATVEDAIELGRTDPSDVVLVDANVAVAALVPVLQLLRRECPLSALIILAPQRGDDDLFHAIEAGAAAHLVDAVRPSELIATIRVVAAGAYVIDASVAARPHVARRVLDAFRSVGHADGLANESRSQPTIEQLSVRETKILTLISEGRTNKEIAAALSISPHTVSNNVKTVLRKLAVQNRTRAVLFALRENWIPAPAESTSRLH